MMNIIDLIFKQLLIHQILQKKIL